jgi:hypothetical protein
MGVYSCSGVLAWASPQKQCFCAVHVLGTVSRVHSHWSRKDLDGNQRKSYDIFARYVQMLSPTANGNGPKTKQTKPTPAQQPSEEENPFNQDETSEIPF